MRHHGKAEEKQGNRLNPLICKRVSVGMSFMLLAGNYGTIYQRDLFRLKQPADEPIKIVEQEATPIIKEEPAVSEQLTLHGIIVAHPSLAIIEDRELRTTSIYREGETVTAGKIVKITKDRVIIVGRDGKQHPLILATTLEHTPFTAAAEKPVDIRADRRPADPEKSGGEEPTPVSLRDIHQITEKNREELRKLSIRPVVSQGEIAGYQVRNIGQGKLADIAGRYGLHNNDIIQSINDVALTSMSETKMNQIARSIRPGSPVSVEIIRQGKPVTINLQLTH